MIWSVWKAQHLFYGYPPYSQAFLVEIVFLFRILSVNTETELQAASEYF